MYGKTTGKLTLYMAPENKQWIYLFTKTGDQGQNWHNADVTLDYKGKFQVSLRSFSLSIFAFLFLDGWIRVSPIYPCNSPAFYYNL